MASVARKVTPEVIGWGVLVMLIVILSIVLVNFKDVSGATAETNTTVDTAVTALQEPANWIEIVIIAVIGAAIVFLFFMLFGKKLKSM